MTSIDLPTEWLAGWLAACEDTKVCPLLVFFPLCIICRYLLDSQDQHVSLGGSALDRKLVNMDGILKDNRRNWRFFSTLWTGHRDLMYIYNSDLYYRGRESPGRGHNNAYKKACKCLRNKISFMKLYLLFLWFL